ncbi:hypothetical protein E4T52_09391 [Aureobasidium sp. EXF-3400]|nr:hypothetical protein E4T51_14310 [Aureobasidium sp. EXF-12344]KAI4775679.1 hypothetical protein E4T52_09391 [Aureobasidium sp. EXF-3400]
MWKQRVKKYRDDELRAEARDFHAQTVSSMWKTASPLVVSGVSIFTHAYLEGRTSASVIFTILELLPQLQGTLGLAPLVIQDYLSARNSSRRIESFLRTPENIDYLQGSASGDVIFRNATFEWPTNHKTLTSAAQNTSSRFKLKDVNVRFPAGKLSIIHGDTGSGKSLMLAAMLGEAELLNGAIEAPCSAHGFPVAFVTQTPWLQSMSIKDNVLFGGSFNKARYDSVLEACALVQDLELLANGDETLMGPQGVKVSGGQRARISLARALYSEATMILMDDILSALDTHVAIHVLDALSGPLGEGRTRILATHQLTLCKPKADYAVRVVDGTVQVESILASNLVRQILVEPDKADWDSDPDCEIPNPKDIPKEDSDKEQQNPPSEPKAVSGINEPLQTVYWTYIEALGGRKFILGYFLALAIRQIFITLPTWTLKNARLEGRDSATHESAIRYHAGMFVVGSTIAVIAEYLFNLLEASGNLRASEALFNSMLDTVVHMPLAWLDNVSTGDLIQRFSSDSQAMDDRLMALVSEFSQCFIETFTIIVVGLNMSLYTGLMVIGGLYASSMVGRLYNKARKTVQRADREPTSKILGLVTATTTGLATIRAFGAPQAFMDQMHNHVDDLSKARRYFWIANRWLGLQMSLIGIMFSFGTGVMLLRSRSAIVDPPLFGFALTFSMRFSSVIFKAVNGFGAFETSATAAGAISAFRYLEIEQQDGIEVASDWPTTGRVEIRGLKMRYSTTLPLVLDNINLTIGAGERVGIVGRTGAGKSTLLLALLRMIEPEEGTITIDGANTSAIRLRDLRRRKHKLIILDEATSAVDDRTDEAIQTVIRADSEQTLIVVAHRLKTVATFDKIVVMDSGKIVEQGSPTDHQRTSKFHMYSTTAIRMHVATCLTVGNPRSGVASVVHDCDLRPEGCSRCENAHRLCPGYPDKNELRICDQSSETMIKAQAQKTAVVKIASSSTRPAVPHGTRLSSQSGNLTTAINIRASSSFGDDDQCLAFFFHTYVVNNNKFHPSISVVGNKHLFASIKALSIAGLSKYHSDTRLSHLARHQYVQALQLTNTALSDPQSAMRDETLLAIVVLTSYETLTGGLNRSLEAWVQHINGATTLLRLRGIDGIKHTDGRILTMHVIAFINITCLLNDLPIPPFIYDLQSRIFEFLYRPEIPAARYQQVSLQFADSNHAFQHHLFGTPEDIIARATGIEAEMTAALVGMPIQGKAEILSPARMPDDKALKGGVPNFELQYKDQATSYVWNSFYSSRILLRQAVLKTVQHVESQNGDKSKYENLKLRCHSIMRDCQTHILASIPPFMRSQSYTGFLLPGRRIQDPAEIGGPQTLQNASNEPSKSDRELIPEAFVSELPVMHALGGYGFLWPLYVVGYCSTTTPEILGYVKDMYQVLGKTMKIEQALVLKDMLCSVSSSV